MSRIYPTDTGQRHISTVELMLQTFANHKISRYTYHPIACHLCFCSVLLGRFARISQLKNQWSDKNKQTVFWADSSPSKPLATSEIMIKHLFLVSHTTYTGEHIHIGVLYGWFILLPTKHSAIATSCYNHEQHNMSQSRVDV